MPTLETTATSPQAVAVIPVETPPAQRSGKVRAQILFATGIFLLLALAWKLLKELEIIYVSAVFAGVLTPVVSRITQLKIRSWHPSRAIAIIILLAILVLAIGLFFTIGVPPVARDIRNFSTDLPQHLPAIVARAKKIPLADKIGLDQIVAKAENAAAATATYLFTSLPLWLSHILDILTATFLCIYFMLEGETAYQFFLSLFHHRSRVRLDATLRKAELKMSKWLLGQGLLMLTLGICSTIVFGILHVRYFILLGVMMGALNLIPIAGGVITIILAGGVAAIDSWTKMLGVFIFYAVYINIENAVLTPRIMKSSVDLSGLTVLVALLIGTALAGIVGALVAVPTAALITVLLDEYAVQRDAHSVVLSPTHL